MGILRQEKFLDLLTASRPMDRMRGQVMPMFRAPGTPERIALEGVNIDRQSALAVYEGIRAYIKNMGCLPGKYLRPWELDAELYAGMDRNQPWWGWEFETGYRSRALRAEVIDHVWDTWDNVVFDSEGEGNAAVEITFPPRPMQEYLDGTADACEFIRYLDGNDRVMNTGNVNIGTHVNMSHPDYNRNNAINVVYSLNRTLAALPNRDGDMNVREHMFGRVALYGGCFDRGDPNNADVRWVEGKFFRTAYTEEKFKIYIRTAEALTKCFDLLCKEKVLSKRDENGNTVVAYVTNLYEVFKDGAEPVLGWDRHRGNLDGARGGGMINGPLASDTFNPDNPAAKPNMGLAYPGDEDDDGYDDEEDDDFPEPEPGDDAYVAPEDRGDRQWCGNCGEYH